MPVAITPRLLCRVAILSILSVATACSIPHKPPNRYQDDIEVSQLEVRPVTELQNQALAALNGEQYQLAVDYLQRAIKIQPRNAWSWHYLAQTYWRDAQYDRCLAMIERSNSYGSFDEDLISANDRLKPKCQPG
ncbi:MAG: tetratricopeptide repeat protein [Gammaproteobacteria bacterium]|nr:tetratricopeptide repeat protein [Gammaproteobacteria bacterium]MDH3859497.1 tetratricopeptide repeat protein [Gammaproteobacteria bacterium]